MWGDDAQDNTPAASKDAGGGWGDTTQAAPKKNAGSWGGNTQAGSKNDAGSWGGTTQTGSNNDTGSWGDTNPTDSKNDAGWGDTNQTCSNNDAGSWGGNAGSGSRNEGGFDSGVGGGFGGGGRGGGGRGGGGGGGGDGEEGEERPPPYKPEELDLNDEARLQGDGAGENFARYADQKVTCLPKDVITPVEQFEDIVKSPLLLGNVKSQKYAAMTPVQKWAMPAIMEGYDIIGCAQTGSGKTAAFLLPVLQTLLNDKVGAGDPNDDCQHPYCLIVSPTRELANQIYVHANLLSKDSIIKCHVIYGQVSTAHLKSRLSTGCHILVATPGRLKDFVQRNWIGFKNIKYIILDEGDRLCDDSFMTDIRNIFNHETMPPKEGRQTLFFSATFKEQTQLNAKEFLSDNFVFLTVGKIGAANEDIKQEFMQVSRQEKKRELKKILSEIPDDEKTIVFTQTKTAADMLAGFFTALNLSSTSIHGDRHQSQREQAIKAFRRGEKRFLISSPVGNRGLDLPKVALVINYDLPTSIDEYVHRIGRTGRAGHTGRAISFFDSERDREIIPDLIEILTDAKQEIPEWMTSDSSSFGGGGDFGEGSDPFGGGSDAFGASAGAAAESWDDPPAKAPASDVNQTLNPPKTPPPTETEKPADSSDWGVDGGEKTTSDCGWGATDSGQNAGDTSFASNSGKRGNDDWNSRDNNKRGRGGGYQGARDNNGGSRGGYGWNTSSDKGSSGWGDQSSGGGGWGNDSSSRPSRGGGRGGFDNASSDGGWNSSGGGGSAGGGWGDSGSRGGGRGGFRGGRGRGGGGDRDSGGFQPRGRGRGGFGGGRGGGSDSWNTSRGGGSDSWGSGGGGAAAPAAASDDWGTSSGASAWDTPSDKPTNNTDGAAGKSTSSNQNASDDQW